jgi:hypothetical protein
MPICDSKKVIGRLGNSTLNFTRKTRRFAIRAISVFLVKFNVEFPRQPMNLPIESHSSVITRALIGDEALDFLWSPMARKVEFNATQATRDLVPCYFVSLCYGIQEEFIH